VNRHLRYKARSDHDRKNLFCSEDITAKRGNNVLKFYNNGEFETWKAENGNNTAGWTIKYFKGLGTSTRLSSRSTLKTKGR
jgi:DNA gyrase/topoisomerase IV subunit B